MPEASTVNHEESPGPQIKSPKRICGHKKKTESTVNGSSGHKSVPKDWRSHGESPGRQIKSPKRSGGHKKKPESTGNWSSSHKRVPKGCRVTKEVLVANLNLQIRSCGHKKKAESAVNWSSGHKSVTKDWSRKTNRVSIETTAINRYWRRCAKNLQFMEKALCFLGVRKVSFPKETESCHEFHVNNVQRTEKSKLTWRKQV